MTILETVKMLLGLTDSSKDGLLNVLIDGCIEEAESYTHNSDIATIAVNTIAQMAVYRYNRMGTEGLNSENYSGVSYSYSGDYPESIMRGLRMNRRVEFL